MGHSPTDQRPSHTYLTSLSAFIMPPKKQSTPKATDADGAPKEKKLNGLTKPMNLSAELAAIVGAKKGEQLARSEIVKRLWAYLKEHNYRIPRTSSSSPRTRPWSRCSGARRSAPSP